MNKRVLFICASRGDAGALSRMLSSAPLDVDHVRSLHEAAALLRRNRFAAILTESILPDGTWREVLHLAEAIPAPCSVIVTDRLADDTFWTDALDLGAYDVLAQPFDSGEVVRILQNACEQSSGRLHAPIDQPARSFRSAI